MTLLIDPYGPMINMKPIRSNQWTAEHIRSLNLLTCASCGARVRRPDTNLCVNCTTELLVSIQDEFGSEREGEA